MDKKNKLLSLKTNSSERIAKAIAAFGVCSRRDAEVLIAEKKVMVNNKLVETPAFFIEKNDIIKVSGVILGERPQMRLWRYHKPAGLITSHTDPENRPTVFNNLPPEMPYVISIGRLDINTEGLLLLTNNGELARKLELPSNNFIRKYRVRVFGKVDADKLLSLKNGITIDGINYKRIDVTVDKIDTNNSWLTVAITEGKNREIRKVMENFNLKVNRLIRVSYGPFQLGKLNRGGVEEVPIRVIKEQLGLTKGWA